METYEVRFIIKYSSGYCQQKSVVVEAKNHKSAEAYIIKEYGIHKSSIIRVSQQ